MIKTALLIGALILGQGSDAATSCHAIQTGRFRETTLFLPKTCGGLVTVKTGLTAAMIVIYQRSTQKRQRWLLLALPALSGGIAAGINVHRIRGGH